MPYFAHFDTLDSPSQLDAALGLVPGTFARVAAAPHDALLVQHTIPKKNRARGFRIVWEVADEAWARDVRVLNHHLTQYLIARADYPGPDVHGYVPKRSIVTNAAAHRGAESVVRADIREFFPTITRDRAAAALVAAGLHASVAATIAGLSCVEDRLALGIATSPTLANLCTIGVDRRLAALAQERNLTYTRYADDLTFSGAWATLPTPDVLRDVLLMEGFALAEDKYRVKKRGQAVVVTGLTVCDPARVHVPKRFKRRLRQELYYASRHGLLVHAGRAGYPSVQTCVNRIDGRIRFVRGVERPLGEQMLAAWEAVLRAANRTVAWGPQRVQPDQVWLLVDESVFRGPSGEIMALAVVRLRDVDAVRTRLSEFARMQARDTFRTGRVSPLLAGGVIHFAHLSEDVRAEVAKVLAELPLRAFIAYTPLPDRTAYAATWQALFRALVRHRFVGLAGATVSIVVEEQSEIRARDLEAIVAEEYAALVQVNSKRPATAPTVRQTRKLDEPAVAVADALLGLFAAYASLRTKGIDAASRPAAEARFERVRAKIRLILSLDSAERFGPRRPFEPLRPTDG